ncbi:22467_t:CDS:1, partial [Entrophospora sp. SA101]
TSIPEIITTKDAISAIILGTKPPPPLVEVELLLVCDELSELY